MPHLGDYPLGASIPILVQTRTNTDNTPTVPDDAPRLKVYDASGTAVVSSLMPLIDKDAEAGTAFLASLFLGLGFATGWYTMAIIWSIGSTVNMDVHNFRIVAGGNIDGAVTACHWFQRPEANYLVQTLESGNIVKGRDPRL